MAGAVSLMADRFAPTVALESLINCSVQQSGVLEEFCSNAFSTAGKSRPSLSAFSWHEQSSAMLSGNSLTSKVRPSMRSASALCIYMAATGSVPAPMHNGGSPGL
jgi:hypothetical protein